SIPVIREASMEESGQRRTMHGEGNGALAAFIQALDTAGHDVENIDYREHSRGQGSDAEAIAYVDVRIGSESVFGVGTDESITSASMKAVMSAINRQLSSAAPAANVTAETLS